MSIRDARALLEDGTYLFLFLPAVNYMQLLLTRAPFYYILDTHRPLTILVSIVSAAFVYNYAAGDPDSANWVIKLLYLLFLVTLLLTYVHSTYSLLINATSDATVTSILLFVSVSIGALLITHNIINRFSEGYDNEL